MAARARQALTIARTRGADPGLSIQLLGDVYRSCGGVRRDRMHTGDLIGELLKLELRTWSYSARPGAIRDTDVARLLEPYDLIRSSSSSPVGTARVHLGGRATAIERSRRIFFLGGPRNCPLCR